jgi:imidazolonepropionase-like amidohydrolase
VVSALYAACSLSVSASMEPAVFDLVIRHARIVHGDGRVTPLATIGITAGRLATIQAEPPNAPRLLMGRQDIDATGKTIVPGLIDAHVHVEEWTLPVFLKYGVTTVRDLHNDPAYIFQLVSEDLPGRPRIVAAGAMLDGPGSFWKNASIVETSGDVRAAVRRAADQGAEVIKVYTRLQPALISLIVSEARARGLPVAAHVGMTNALEAAACGITSLEHLSGVADAVAADPEAVRTAHEDFLAGWTRFEREWRHADFARLDEVAARLIAAGVTIVPTLALHEAFSRLDDKNLLQDAALGDVPPAILKGAWAPSDLMGRAHWTPQILAEFKQALPFLQHFVGTYARLKGRIVAGTDTPQQFVVPGASLHRELALYVNSGLSPAAALRTATIDAADLLGLSAQVGTIAPGKDADLLILDADPLKDISATRRIWKVIHRGAVVAGGELIAGE